MHMYTHISIIDFITMYDTDVCEKNSSGEEGTKKYQLSKHQVRGWRAVSAAGLQGKG